MLSDQFVLLFEAYRRHFQNHQKQTRKTYVALTITKFWQNEKNRSSSILKCSRWTQLNYLQQIQHSKLKYSKLITAKWQSCQWVNETGFLNPSKHPNLILSELLLNLQNARQKIIPSSLKNISGSFQYDSNTPPSPRTKLKIPLKYVVLVKIQCEVPLQF